MIAQIREEIVTKREWLTEDELIEVIAIAESTPGPIAINLATYVGYKQKGFWGSLLATLGVSIPSVIIIYIISLFFLMLFLQTNTLLTLLPELNAQSHFSLSLPELV